MDGASPFGPATLAAPVVIVPGLGGSGEGHWQTLWERAHPRAIRIRPASWDAPDVQDWIAAVDRSVRAHAEPPLIVAHSLGTIATMAWALDHPGRARAALLVAPPDAARPGAPPVIRAFAAVQPAPLRMPVAVVASENDPYAGLDHSREVARRLGCEPIVPGALGHLNADSSLGEWSEGAALLEHLARASAA
ncbi:RBBP9/YdeN family alpha/beta hydrolase [Demequina activiva]|uniref:Alpha/beta hydrolase n=1 Tax=Demequina activiva TaxID=1582364 RepID=A0A919ULG2_9MICO|nr:alpha/beta hydrolase [Demequina activiva]GIG54688.1 hypothetical protein Dac01nite_14400 [Demequina activiva]